MYCNVLIYSSLATIIWLSIKGRREPNYISLGRDIMTNSYIDKLIGNYRLVAEVERLGMSTVGSIST